MPREIEQAVKLTPTIGSPRRGVWPERSTRNRGCEQAGHRQASALKQSAVGLMGRRGSMR